MDEKLAMEMFENGEAFGVYTSIIIMEAHGRVYFSLDGYKWHEIDHPALKECLNAAKKVSGRSGSGD